eukprot:12341866-Alexandrium_andersonii.AAC.1
MGPSASQAGVADHSSDARARGAAERELGEVLRRGREDWRRAARQTLERPLSPELLWSHPAKWAEQPQRPVG